MTKIVTWNVNGIRSRKNLSEVFKTESADIYCIQETKIPKDQIEENIAFVDDYHSCFAIPKQEGFKGRSGCATYYLESARPYHIEYGILDEDSCSLDWKDHASKLEDISTLEDIKNLDSEGRVLITCHEIKVADDVRKLFLFNVYFPRLDVDKEGRAEFKDKFNRMIEEKAEFHLQEPSSHVIICCDLNIEHQQIDTFDPPKKDFEADIYRKWVSRFLKAKNQGRHMVDSFRKVFPNKKSAFTCWPAMVPGSRSRNLGARIDCIFVDSELVKCLSKVEHLTQIMGSDHCPVSIELKGVKFIGSKKQPNGCTRTWQKFSKRQANILSYIIRQPKPSSAQESGPFSQRDNRTNVDGFETCNIPPRASSQQNTVSNTQDAASDHEVAIIASKSPPAIIGFQVKSSAIEKIMQGGSQTPKRKSNFDSKSRSKSKRTKPRKLSAPGK